MLPLDHPNEQYKGNVWVYSLEKRKKKMKTNPWVYNTQFSGAAEEQDKSPMSSQDFKNSCKSKLANNRVDSFLSKLTACYPKINAQRIAERESSFPEASILPLQLLRVPDSLIMGLPALLGKTRTAKTV